MPSKTTLYGIAAGLGLALSNHCGTHLVFGQSACWGAPPVQAVLSLFQPY